jgi:cyclopropane-fatty-acyl-phospholipid synthase
MSAPTKTSLRVEKAKVGSLFDRQARRVLYSRLSGLESGALLIEDSEGTSVFGRVTDDPTLDGRIRVHDHRFYRYVLLGGTVGAAESYMEGLWTTKDLTAVIRVLVRNLDRLQRIDGSWSRILSPLHRLAHVRRKNTRSGSKRNIVAHYDLGNEFFALFLDESLTYSSAIFESQESTLKQAQRNKLDRICRKLSLSPGEQVIEIGGGWGSFAIHAAKHYGCRVTTTTISDEQFNLARKRVEEAGLSHMVEVIKKDYRDLTGRFDKLVSIEMIEAVGHHYFDAFFRCCSRLLKPGGAMALQAITIPDHVYERHKRTVDFIKRYVFPGSCIPSVAAIMKSVARKTDLRLVHYEDITPHYARTLRTWRKNFFRNIEKVRKMGYTEAFIRMWEFYLCYCEGSFQERYNGDVQMIFAKPLNRMSPILPPLRAGMERS